MPRSRCCDRCHAERVVPERARRILERDAKREGNGGALQCLQYNRSDRWLRSRIRYSRVGFAAADAKRQNVGGMTGIESRWTRLKLSCRLACEASGAAP